MDFPEGIQNEWSLRDLPSVTFRKPSIPFFSYLGPDHALACHYVVDLVQSWPQREKRNRKWEGEDRQVAESQSIKDQRYVAWRSVLTFFISCSRNRPQFPFNFCDRRERCGERSEWSPVQKLKRNWIDSVYTFLFYSIYLGAISTLFSLFFVLCAPNK